MPLYEYECKQCGYRFEHLFSKSEDSGFCKCRKCGADAGKKMSSFSSVVPGSESEDVLIGREAEKRWEMYSERQDKRRRDKKFENIKLKKNKGTYTPVMNLGNKDEKEKRMEYSKALQEHRKEREKRGQPQFSEAGSF